ncbi:MAG: lipid-A-disaccharide synthase [Burkholderiales bacterium]
MAGDEPLRAGIVAGEASGDLLGSHLVGALLAREPRFSFTGIGGPRMIAHGVQSLYPMEKLAVRGYAEVLRHYRGIMAIRRELASSLLSARPAVFIGIDAPDFNLELERQFRDKGIPAIHFVGPSVWAWRRWRLRRIAKCVTHMLVMFPFEPPIYEAAGIPATYVGHPVADTVPLQVDRGGARAALDLPAGKLVVALLPGSRRQELQYMADGFVRAAMLLHAQVREAHFVFPASSTQTRALFEQAVVRNRAGGLPLTLLSGRSHEVLAAADLALVGSGTATLEAALYKTPMVITYRQSPLTWAIMKRMLYLPWIGLPNILAGESLVDELVQEQATPESLCAALLALHRDPGRQAYQRDKFHDIHVALRQDTASKAAAAVMRVLDAGRA